MALRQGKPYCLMFIAQNVVFQCAIAYSLSVKNPAGRLSTHGYGEVSPILLGQSIAEGDIFGSK